MYLILRKLNMQVSVKLIVIVAAAAFAGVATAQPATSVGRAASAAVTPGDQDMGRNPNNRSGGLMGNDNAAGSAATRAGRAASAAVTPGDQDMGRNPNNRSGGLMGNDRSGVRSATTSGRRPARADRG